MWFPVYRMEAVPCYHHLPSLSPRPQKTMTDRQVPKSWVICVALHCSAALGLGSLSVLTPCCHFGCWTQFHVAATSTTTLLTLLHPSLLRFVQLPLAQLDWGSPLPLRSLWYHLTPSPPFSTTSILCFSAFQHHILEPQLGQMEKG